MHDPQEPPTRLYLHLTATQVLIGAGPALLGVILGVMHAHDPILEPGQQGMLLVAMILLVCASFFLWLLFAANSIARDFQSRHDEIKELIVAHTRASDRDFRAAMHRLHKACKKSDQASTEVEHLKRIILDGTDWPRQDLP